MTEAPSAESPAGSRTDKQLSDAIAENLRSGSALADTFGDSGMMTGGIQVEEVNAKRDVVFRDKINNTNILLDAAGRGREPTPLALSRDVLDQVRNAFVPPKGFAELSVDQRLLIIQVPRGRGGGTAAARLLLDNGAAAVKELAPDIALRRLTNDRLEPRTGYLLRNASATVLEALTEFEIARLCEGLGDLDSQLILTVDPQVRFSEALLSRYTARLGDPPAAADVLGIHLRRLLRQHDPDGTRTNEILCDPTVIEMLADSAGREDRVNRSASFARILADAERAGAFDLGKIRDQLKRITDASFEAWFDDLDSGSRCFAIALAALPGYSYEIVSDAATLLEQALIPPVPEAPGVPAADPFRIRRTQRLDTVLARVTNRQIPTRYGFTPMEVVSFIDPSLSREILGRIWTEYAETRLTLLQWLRDLARHRVADVRNGAANAVGVFAVHAFDYVRRYVILPWADSGDSLDRQAAASALREPAQDAAVSQATRNMLYDWHLDRSNPRLRNTAARAYGYLGIFEVDATLDAFAHLAIDLEDNLDQVIANGVTLLIIHGDETVALQVLRRLQFWTTSPAIEPPPGSLREYHDLTPREKADDCRARLFTAYYSFLTAAVQARLRNPVDSRPDATAWHGLLWLADRNPDIATVVARLWADALVHPITHEPAMTALTSWAVGIDKDSTGREAFAHLVSAAVRSGRRARATITGLARSWQTGRDPIAPQAAAAVMRALDTDATAERRSPEQGDADGNG